MKGEPKERFEAKFEKGEESDCWNWTASKFRTGYGMFDFDGRIQTASRVAYQLYVGEIPDGLCICHSCDSPTCVNPAHLFLGTIADNMHDRDNKGRGGHLYGEKNGRSKLTEADVRTIRSRHANGESQADLAREFGVTSMTICYIVHYLTWTKI